MKIKIQSYKYVRYRSTEAQMAERVPRDQKVPSSNPALDPMRRVSKLLLFKEVYWVLFMFK